MAKKDATTKAETTPNGSEDFLFGANAPEKSRLPEPPAEPTRANGKPVAPNPFSAESLRLPKELTAGVGVKKALLTIPARKPEKSWFVRTHPDEAYQLETAVIELDREVYLVGRDLWSDLAAESTFSRQALFTAINKQGVLFLWQVKLPRGEGRGDSWSNSALEIVELARTSWVRVQSSFALGAYEAYQAVGNLPDPEWPRQSFDELLAIAFKNHLIASFDHPVLRKLRGEV